MHPSKVANIIVHKTNSHEYTRDCVAGKDCIAVKILQKLVNRTKKSVHSVQYKNGIHASVYLIGEDEKKPSEIHRICCYGHMAFNSISKNK
jgi:hypothetical protein